MHVRLHVVESVLLISNDVKPLLYVTSMYKLVLFHHKLFLGIRKTNEFGMFNLLLNTLYSN